MKDVLYFLVGRKQRGSKRLRIRYPKALPPVTSSFNLKFPESPAIVPPAGEKCSEHEPMRDNSYSNQNKYHPEGLVSFVHS